MEEKRSMKRKVVIGPVARDEAPVLPGSELHECGDCGKPVWIAPSSRGKLEKGFEVMCFDCASELKVKLDHIHDITEEQLDEIEGNLGYRPTREELKEGITEFFF